MNHSNLTGSQLSLFNEEIGSNIPFEHILKGYALYESGQAKAYHLSSQGVLIGLFTGEDRIIKASVDLDFFSVSSCACGTAVYCEHMAAMFFQICRDAGLNPFQYLSRFRESLTTKQITPPVTKIMRKDTLPRKPAPSDTPDMWHSYFVAQYGKKMNEKNTGAGLDNYYTQATKNLFRLAENWEPTICALFRLHAMLFVLVQIDDYLRQRAKSYYLPYYMNQSVLQIFHISSQDLGETLGNFLVQSTKNQYEAAYQGLRDILAKQAFLPAASMMDFPGLYRILWMFCLNDADWVEEERRRLTVLSAHTDLTSYQASRIHAALALFDFLDGEDLVSISRLKQMDSLTEAEFDLFLQQLVSRRYWSRLLVWLQEMSDHIQDRGYLNGKIFPYWQEGALAQPDNPDWEQWIISKLPLSRGYYMDYLLKQGKARQIVHMHLSQGLALWQIDSRLLKQIEQEDMRLLLPLYHQEAENFILQKNRDSYKQAVKRLKKLAALYRKLKELDRWGAYIEQLSARYSRLRAFQEELKKGKLIL